MLGLSVVSNKRAAAQALPFESKALSLTHVLGTKLPFASSKLGPAALHTKSTLLFRLLVGTMWAEIPDREFRAFHSNRWAETLETSDRH